MSSVAEVLRRYAPEYLARFGDKMPAEHRKVISALLACRTGELGTLHYQCTGCGHSHVIGRSCGNRHCPTCQQHKAQAWLQKQMSRLLPCSYFLITFTVPPELRPFIRSNQRIAYAAMFEASSEALKTLAADPKYVGTQTPGFFGVLHTWGRQLDYHPHIHYVVPGGGLSEDGESWLPSRPAYFVNVKALSAIYRAKLRDALQQAGLLSQTDPKVWQWHRKWVVHSQAVGDGRTSLQYLAPYVFRVAISDRRIIDCDDNKVTLSYRPSGTKHWQNMQLCAMEFLRRFLQHILPSGFVKVRHYGFLSPSSRQSFESLQWLVCAHYEQTFELTAPAQAPATDRGVYCPECGEAMVFILFIPPLPDRPTPPTPLILDSS